MLPLFTPRENDQHRVFGADISHRILSHVEQRRLADRPPSDVTRENMWNEIRHGEQLHQYKINQACLIFPHNVYSSKGYHQNRRNK